MGPSNRRPRGLKASSCGKGVGFAITAPENSPISGCYAEHSQHNGEAVYSSKTPGTGNYIIGAVPVVPVDIYYVRMFALTCNRRFVQVASRPESHMGDMSVAILSTIGSFSPYVCSTLAIVHFASASLLASMRPIGTP